MAAETRVASRTGEAEDPFVWFDHEDLFGHSE
jgi:hypothetical protein